MTELSFLVSLLLDHKLPKATQKAVKDRISEVERGISGTAPAYARAPQPPGPRDVQVAANAQPESTRRLLEKHGLAAPTASPPASPIPEPAPGIAVASPQAAEAIRQRQAMMNKAQSGYQKGDVTAPKIGGGKNG